MNLLNQRLYKCEWNIGDVYAYKLESMLALEKNLFGRYILLHKVDEGTWYPGHVVPIVRVKITSNDVLPENVDQFNSLEYVQTWFTRFEERYFPLDYSRLEEDIAEKSKIIYQVDEYGFLPQYRIKLISISKRIIPKKLIYIGNFSDVIPPNKEFVPHTKINIQGVRWKDLEEDIIISYHNHNLRELDIYK